MQGSRIGVSPPCRNRVQSKRSQCQSSVTALFYDLGSFKPLQPTVTKQSGLAIKGGNQAQQESGTLAVQLYIHPCAGPLLIKSFCLSMREPKIILKISRFRNTVIEKIRSRILIKWADRRAYMHTHTQTSWLKKQPDPQ